MPGDLLTPYFRATYEDVLTPSQQQQAVDSLLDYIHEVQFGTEEQRLDLGVIDDEDVAPEVISRKLNATLEKCYWQLVMFFRSAKPSQIACAEPYLRYLLETPAVKTSPASEVLAQLHLAGALAAPPPFCTYAHSPSAVGKITEDSAVTCFHSDSIVPTVGIIGVHYTPKGARDAEALALFARAFATYDAPRRPSRSPSPAPSALGLDVPPAAPGSISHAPSPTFAYCARAPSPLDSPRARLVGLCGRRGRLPPKTELWARAAYVKLLRRLDAPEHTLEAARQLETMRAYVHENPYALPDAKYAGFLGDLAREFDVHVPLHPDEQPAHVERSYIPPSSACSSASSSSCASPQTPHTPLSPVHPFTSPLYSKSTEPRIVIAAS